MSRKLSCRQQELDAQYGHVLAQTTITFGSPMYKRALKLLEAANELGADTREFRQFCEDTKPPDAGFSDRTVISILSQVPADGAP